MILDEGCSHVRTTRPRKRIVANGKIQYRRQCLDCGTAVGDAVSARIALEETQGSPYQFDEDLFNRKQQEFEDRRKQEYENESAAWWAWYNDYLKSADWLARREKVLARCRHLCEGCGEAPAVHVHHLTYEHVGAELLFELVGVCLDCHYHAHTKTERAAEAQREMQC